MTGRHAFAVSVALAAMALALAQPLWIWATGDEVALEIRPLDPLSLFRGNYVDLTYAIDIEPSDELGNNDVVYVVFDDSRPARPVRTASSRPELVAGETCVQGRVTGRAVSLPTLEQYFVTPEEGRELERDLSSMVGIIKATGSCQAILVSIEPR